MWPIDGGQEQVRVGAALLDAPLKALVDQDVHGAGTVGTGGRDLDLQKFVSEAPFDEGRSEGILRSSTEDALSGAEAQAVRSAVGGDGKSPAYVAAGIADEEEQVLFQFFQ